jgi:signal transduction histidine kinase
VQLVIDAGYRGAAWFDEQKMLRVVHNIARNAAQAMPAAARSASARAPRGQLVSSSATPAAASRRDGGPAVRALRDRGKKDGSGLGLAIVKKIVDEHRGSISYESRYRPGGGTTFHHQAAAREAGGGARGASRRHRGPELQADAG